MNVSKILAALRQEREQIEESILSLERLAGPRRGRPPAGRRGSGSAGGGSTPLPSCPRRRLADCRTRKRRVPRTPNLKN
jgi:hypothetical protein